MSNQYRTAPCLLDELLLYDPRHFDSDRQPATSCQHAFSTSVEQSSLPTPDEKPSLGEEKQWRVVAICQICRCHLDLIVNFPSTTTTSCPSVNFPLHHFSLKENRPLDGAIQQFYFICTAPICHCTLLVQVRPPSLTPSDLLLLTSPVALKARFQTVRARLPDRQGIDAVDALGTFRSYVRDSINNEVTKRISLQNKKFMSALGEGSADLLRRLGFTLEPGKNASEWSYWRLPNPSKEADDGLRLKLLDVMDELTVLMQSRPDEEKRKTSENLYRPPPSTQDMERCLGSLECKLNSFKSETSKQLHLRRSCCPINAYFDYKSDCALLC